MRLPPRSPLALLALLTACAGAEEKAPPTAGAPAVVADPVRIDFGGLPLGFATFAEVTLHNEGDADLLVEGLSFADPTEAKFTVSAVSAERVPPGEVSVFSLAFTPDRAREVDTTVFVDTNDPVTPRLEIDAVGSGLAPEIDLSFDSIAFGTLYIGCEVMEPLTIRNAGSEDLVVTRLDRTYSSAELWFEDLEHVNGALPWTIAPGETREVFLGYAPVDEGADTGAVTVSSNDPLQPEVRVDLEGNGAAFGSAVETFVQPGTQQADLLFAVDASAGATVAANVAHLRDALPGFLDALDTLGVDYQVAVVIADDGCVTGPAPFLDPSVPAGEREDVLDAMFAAEPDRYMEAGFTLLEAATDPDAIGPGGCNEGLLRETAVLALVGLTDEREQSGVDWADWFTLFEGRAGDDLVVHAIAGDYPTGCGNADPGLGWYELSVATDGEFLSICAADWAPHLDAIAEGSLHDLDSFGLADWPVPETLVVTIDGVAMTEGWSYNATERSVDFSEAAVPAAGAVVEVRYELFGDCEG